MWRFIEQIFHQLKKFCNRFVHTFYSEKDKIQNIVTRLFTSPNVCVDSVNMMVYQNNVIQGLRTSIISNEKQCFVFLSFGLNKGQQFLLPILCCEFILIYFQIDNHEIVRCHIGGQKFVFLNRSTSTMLLFSIEGQNNVMILVTWKAFIIHIWVHPFQA